MNFNQSNGRGLRGYPFTAIMACTPSGGIGKNGTLPWPHHPGDMKHFRQTTSGKMLIVGSTSYDEIRAKLGKPFGNGRTTLILTSDPLKYDADIAAFPEQVATCNSVSAIANLAEAENGDKEIMVIGGGKVFVECLPYIHKIHLTIMHAQFECDTFVPIKYIHDNFKIVSGEQFEDRTNVVMVRRS